MSTSSPSLSYLLGRAFILATKEIVAFGRNTWGILEHPYITYRSLVQQSPWQLVYLFFLVGIYFFAVSPLKIHSFNPLLLSLNAYRLFFVSVSTFLLVVGFFMLMGKLWGSKARMTAVMTAWGYTLVPTLIWFWATTIFYILLPPPRHDTFWGIFFSYLFLSFCVFLFLWKGLLYYLTLRFALKLTLPKILATSAVFIPLLTLYTLLMYRFGIFRVPFV